MGLRVFAPALGILLSAVLARAAPSQVVPGGEAPNILLIVTDDNSRLEYDVYGWSEIEFPAFTRVAEEGVLFNQAHSSAPSCAPARASILTGRNFWELDEGSHIQAWLPLRFPQLDYLMQSAGYAIGATGKVWGPGVDSSFTEGFRRSGDGWERAPIGADGVYPKEPIRPAGGAFPKYDSVRIEDQVPHLSPIDYAANFETFLDDHRPDHRPFFFWMGTRDPHGPWDGDNYIRFEEEYGVTLDDIPVPGHVPDTPVYRRLRANMLYELRYADDRIARTLEILEERGLLENTLVIVTADNGSPRVPRSKATAYEWGTHVPLAVMWPRGIRGGRVVDDFVNFPDLTCTILEAAGVPAPETMIGRSLLEILKSDEEGRVDPSRDYVVTGLEWHGEMGEQNRAGRMIRDARYAYVVHYGHFQYFERDLERERPDKLYERSLAEESWQNMIRMHPSHPAIVPYARLYLKPSRPEELYDLKHDPWKMNDVVDDPEYAEVRERLKTLLHEYQMETGDPRATGDMKVFDRTREIVRFRKEQGYGN